MTKIGKEVLDPDAKGLRGAEEFPLIQSRPLHPALSPLLTNIMKAVRPAKTIMGTVHILVTVHTLQPLNTLEG